MPIELMLVSVFVITLVAFHLLWVVYIPKSAVFWHAVDYVWLTIALAAVVPQLLDISRLLAGYEEESTRGDAVLSHFRLRELSRPIQPCWQAPAADARALCEWKEEVNQQFGADLPQTPPNRWGGVLGEPPSVAAPSARVVIDLIADAHRTFVADVERWRKAYARSQPSDLSIFMLAASPFLLAFAVALRATKVSAQIRAERARGRLSAAAAGDAPPPAAAAPEPPDREEPAG